MAKTVFAIVVILASFISLQAEAQSYGRLHLAADAQASTCNIYDTVPGVVWVHMVLTYQHPNGQGVGSVQFAAPKPSCWPGAMWLGDNIPYFKNGDTQMTWPYGVVIGFGACVDGPIYLGSMVYFTQGQSIACCSYPVVKALHDFYPQIPSPIVQPCPIRTEPVVGVAAGVAVINAEPRCDCDAPVPVQETTWGAVKRLYDSDR